MPLTMEASFPPRIIKTILIFRIKIKLESHDVNDFLTILTLRISQFWEEQKLNCEKQKSECWESQLSFFCGRN